MPCKWTWDSEDGKEENVYDPGDGHGAVSLPLSRAQYTGKCCKTQEECLRMCTVYTSVLLLMKDMQCQHEYTGTGTLE